MVIIKDLVDSDFLFSLLQTEPSTASVEESEKVVEEEESKPVAEKKIALEKVENEEEVSKPAAVEAAKEEPEEPMVLLFLM